MKYLIGGGALVLTVLCAVLLFPRSDPVSSPAVVATAPSGAAAAPEPLTAPEVSIAPEMVGPPSSRPVSTDQNERLRVLAANTRESLPLAVTETLTMTDTLFLPRMRIMEYTYVLTAFDAPFSPQNMRALIDAGAERLCVEGRAMFEMGVTLRNSFKDGDGVLFQRVYLLPEDCQKFY